MSNSFKLILSVLLMIMLVLSVGCQPTPSAPIVVGKNSGYENIPTATDAAEIPVQTIESDNWVDSFESKDKEFIVNINASIEASNIKPTIDTVKPISFTNDQLISMVKVLSENGSLYITDGRLSKEIIEQMIIEWKAYKQTISDQATVAMIDGNIQNLEEEYKTVPMNSELLNTPTTIDNFLNEKQNICLFKNKQNEICQIDFCNVYDDSRNIQISMRRINNEYINAHKQDDPPRGMNITFEDAKNKAQTALENMGIENIGLSDWYIADKTSEASLLISMMSGQESTDSKQCYEFYFTREKSDLTINYVYRHNGTESGEGVYNKHWVPEYICIQIDDDGIASFNYINPVAMTDSGKEETTLLPFGQIKEKFKFYMMGLDDNMAGVLDSVNIESIKLGWAFLVKKDSQDEYKMVPVWDFFGYKVNKLADSDKEQVIEGPAYTQLTINAIDGSIIDRGLGY